MEKPVAKTPRLGLSAKIIRLPDRAKIEQYLNAHTCDIVMSGSVLRPGIKILEIK